MNEKLQLLLAGVGISGEEFRVLCAMGRPGDTSKVLVAMSGKDARRARDLVRLGFASLYGGAGDRRWYFVRTEAGQRLVAEGCRQ
jgi:hypothetical protein